MKLKTVSLVVSALISSSAFANSGYQYSDGLEIKLSDGNKNASIIKKPKLSRPTLMIEKPDSNNVSYNRFEKLNVGRDGLYINNRENASVIITEVVSGKPSTLAGDINVTFNDASLIIANPNGITCSGCSFTHVPDATLVTAKITEGSVKNQPMTYESIDGKINIINANISGKNNLSLISNNISINNSNIKTDNLNITLLATKKINTITATPKDIRGKDITTPYNDYVIKRDASKLVIDSKSSLLSKYTDIKMKETNFINDGVIEGYYLNINSSKQKTHFDTSVDNGNIINMVNNGKINNLKFTLSGKNSTFQNSGDITSNYFSSDLYFSTFVNNGSISSRSRSVSSSDYFNLTMRDSKFINNNILKTPKLSIKYEYGNQFINNGELYYGYYDADKVHDQVILDAPGVTPYTFNNSGKIFIYNMKNNKYEESSSPDLYI